MTSIRTSFQLRRASDVLSKIQGLATAAALVTRLTPLSILGLAAHFAGFIVAISGSELHKIAAGWSRIQLDTEIHKIARAILAPLAVQTNDDWLHCELGNQAVLVHMAQGDSWGAFYAERDPEAVIAFIRDGLWAHYGDRVSIAPAGQYGESIALRATEPAPAPDSKRAQEIWRRIGPYIAHQKPRSVLLDGPPGSGKSTVARRLIELTEAQLGRPLRVVRIAVADFAYLRTSTVEAAMRLLLPDAIFIDDVDRIYGSDALLDFFELARRRSRILIATCNDSSKLSKAVRRPERFDLIEVVEGVGEELAASIFGARWADLEAEQQAQLARWPAVFVASLAETMLIEPETDLAAEMVLLQARVSEMEKPAAVAPAAPTAVATAT